MKKLLLLTATALAMAACSESSTAPAASKKAPSSAKFDEDFTCRSGYVIAYDENGNPYCVPDTEGGTGDGLRVQAPAPLQPSAVLPTRPKA
ncbi:MAG TPA: hypothetical protein VK636_21800 [Gemmatimonadaceae bacterium]|nr:hypothetical protein [Gemmatimonadaceae bacterium]